MIVSGFYGEPSRSTLKSIKNNKRRGLCTVQNARHKMAGSTVLGKMTVSSIHIAVCRADGQCFWLYDLILTESDDVF